MRSKTKWQFLKVIIIVGFVISAYMMYVLTVKVYKNYLIDSHIDTFMSQNKKLAEQYESALDDLKYFESDLYAEKVAKESFGKVRPGEEVLVLLSEDLDSKSAREEKNEEIAKRYSEYSNPQKWWFYFFERRVYDIKEG